MRWVLAGALVLLLAPQGGADAKKEEPKAAQTIEELRQQLEKILKDTHTPGASVAIVRREGPEWVAGLGTADVASGRAVTPETLFRIGSTSKAFASLAILLLADEGKVSLEDPVHKLAPEVWFENRWEASDPMRVVNLLEHTTGWDDMHLREYALNAPPEMRVAAALDYDHHSRISRWPPGTRMSYCNSGPAVAAYIVEKLTGQRFEDFVEQRLFRPIGMKTATYFPPAAGTATTLYHGDGKTPYPYWNIEYRPSGAINASGQDMAAYVHFYLNRGRVNGVQVVPETDIDRAESPKSTWAAREGLKDGYGLGNYWAIQKGYVYHGHNGGVLGGLTEMAYLPDEGAGYFFSINAGNGAAFEKVSEAIRGYLTHNLKPPSPPPVVPLPANVNEYEGWYEPDSPRVEMTHFIERLLGLSLVWFEDGKLRATSLRGWKQTFVPVTGRQFRRVPKKEPPEPVATVALLAPNDEGRFLQAGIQTTMKHIPTWLALGEIGMTLYFLVAFLAIAIYAPFWLLGGLSRKRRRPAERGMRGWPLVAVLIVVALGVLTTWANEDPFARLGSLTVWSAGLCAGTIAFAVAVLASAVALWRAPKEGVRRGVFRFSVFVTVALLIAAAYLVYWGMIGLRTWV
jgi:CubicO group peptidase (beta-lactamase class C family)